MTEDRDFIERCFGEGMRDGEYADRAVADLTLPRAAACPYDRLSLAAHWWTRGFAYASRNLRAVRAERLNAELLAALKAMAYDVDTLPDGELCFCYPKPDDGHLPECVTARAAIAKAEGR